MARHLITHGYNVNTYVINCSDKRSKDFLVNYDRIKQVTKDWPTLLSCTNDFPSIGSDDIIIDAVFGIGLNRPADEWVEGLFKSFRDSKAFTLSIDIPSGLYTDHVPEDENSVVWATYTLSFQAAKLVFFLPDTAKFTTHWEILDIGIDPEYIYNTQTESELIGKNEVIPMYKPRDRFSNKGHFGHSLIIGGSYGKIGAVVLASRAALSAGAGLVSAYIPKCGYSILQSTFPEAMVVTDPNETNITDINFDIDSPVIAFGVGIGVDARTVKAFEAFLALEAKKWLS